MKHGVYVGPDERLVGKKALLLDVGFGLYRAQFDETTLILDGVAMGYTWTQYPVDYFKLDSCYL